ncbi:MAG: hypothetical protein K9M45_12085 [Kiritimatiellales bacterium]|nr:hypothetical protein [Kiritimatiellales bacterium]
MKRTLTKLIHEGDYVAEVDVALIDSEEGWAPYISLDDASKLDDVREALRQGNLHKAAQLGKVFAVTPLTSKVAEEQIEYKTN